MTKSQFYLFVHYREAEDRSGEQVHFAVSTDGYHWESVNHGKPIFFAEKGERGVRDLSILKTQEGRYIILGTDLCMTENFARNMIVNGQTSDVLEAIISVCGNRRI